MNDTLKIDWNNIISSWNDLINTAIIATILLIAFYLVIKHILKPYLNHWYIKKEKEQNFKQEQFWIFYKDSIDSKDNSEKIKKELDELKKKEEELNKGESRLKTERENFEKEILEAKIKAYEEIIKKIKA